MRSIFVVVILKIIEMGKVYSVNLMILSGGQIMLGEASLMVL